MSLWWWVPAAYLLGATPFSYLVVRGVTGRDVRRYGSGNPGATNALRVAGVASGVVCLVLDVAKGAVPVSLARVAGAPSELLAATATAAVLGHVFSPFLRFRGGKGVATAAGALGALAPLPAVILVLFFVGVVACTGYVALGSVLCALLFPVAIYGGQRLGWVPAGGWLVAAAAAIGLLVILRHGSNLQNLWRGTEARLRDPARERPEQEEA